MSTLLEIEEAIGTLPGDQVVELALWLEDYQVITGVSEARDASSEVLAAQFEVARNRMIALDAGRSQEIPGEVAHAMVHDFIARSA